MTASGLGFDALTAHLGRRPTLSAGALSTSSHTGARRAPHLVDAGHLLVPTHGWRYAIHFMLTYKVPVGGRDAARLLAQDRGQNHTSADSQ